MISAIGESLPLALGIAISPVPVIAAILMLLAPDARTTSVGFLVGWTAGIVVAITVMTLLATVLAEPDEQDSAPIAGAITIVAGALLVLLAVRQFRNRPASGGTTTMPAWMSALDTFTPAKALGLGFVLAAVNPKNVLLALSAGTIIGTADVVIGERTVAIAVFTVIAASTVLVPVLGHFLARERAAAPLGRLRAWLVDNSATIMAVLLFVVGATVLGKGLARF